MNSFAQIDFKNPPWETGCDSLTTQTEMNICSYEKFEIADSILNSYYNKLIEYVDSQYQKEKEFKDTNDVFQKEYLQQLKDQKDAVIKSKTNFREFRNSTTDIIYNEYKGGSINPMIVNLYAIDLTVNQIKVLINLMDDIIVK